MEWTQEKTAELLDVKVRLYRGWEYGEFIPSAEQLINIAVKFALSQEDADILYRAAAQAPPKIRHLPFPRNPLFTGRESQLDQLHQYLEVNETVAVTQPVSISGLGGIGKTQLALEYAYRCYQNNVYRAVLWVNAADKDTLEASYGDLAEPLGLPERNEREPGKRIQAVMQWLEDHTNWLLIMDNADNLQLARSFFPKADHARILLTTRSQIVGNTVAKQIDINKMEPDEGLLYLLLRSKILEDRTKLNTVTTGIREAASQVVELLGGHPLALDQAGAYIEDTGVSFTEYTRRYDRARRDLLDRRGSQDEENEGKYSEHPETVATTFDLCFEMARKQHPMSTDILCFCAFIKPDDIPMALFEHDDNFKYGTAVFDDAIVGLQRYSLIKRHIHEQTFSIHRLVQAVLIDAMSPDVERQWRGRIVHAVCNAFQAIDLRNWIRNVNQYKRLVMHVLTISAWPEDKLTPTEEIAALFNNAAIYVSANGLDVLALFLLRVTFPIFLQIFGEEHPRTATAMSNLASFYHAHAMGAPAEDLYERAFAIRDKLLGFYHPDTVITFINLATLDLEFEYELAGQLLEDVIPRLEERLWDHNPHIALGLYNLAVFYIKHGKYEQAVPLLQRAFWILENHIGTGKPEVSLLLYRLAALLNKYGQHDLAGALFQPAINMYEQLFGPIDPNIQEINEGYVILLQGIGYDDRVVVLKAISERSI